jgi:hypothetical protein
MKPLLLTLLLLMAGLVSAQTQSVEFPRAFTGEWRGTLVVANPGGASQSTPMSLRIDSLKLRPAPGRPSRYGWTILYGGQEPRKYDLVIKDAKAGRYQIDEKDGILLDAVLVGNRLISQFQVAESLLTSTYTFLPDKVIFELVFAGTKTTQTGARSTAPITLYPVGGYHRAELSRAP